MKKLAALFLALIMCFGLMNFAAAEDDITLDVLLPDFYSDSEWQTLEDGNPVLQAIYEATGVKLNIRWSPNSGYGDTTTLTMGDPKNMPEVMVMQGPRDAITIDSARAGAFWDLTDYIADAENYPNLAAGQQTVYDNTAIDGRVYGIYRARPYARAGYLLPQRLRQEGRLRDRAHHRTGIQGYVHGHGRSGRSLCHQHVQVR